MPKCWPAWTLQFCRRLFPTVLLFLTHHYRNKEISTSTKFHSQKLVVPAMHSETRSVIGAVPVSNILLGIHSGSVKTNYHDLAAGLNHGFCRAISQNFVYIKQSQNQPSVHLSTFGCPAHGRWNKSLPANHTIKPGWISQAGTRFKDNGLLQRNSRSSVVFIYTPAP